MCRTQTYEWWKRFEEGRTSVDDDPCSGRPPTSKTDDNVAKFREVIRSDRRLTVREVAEEVSISKTVYHEILTENLGMHRIAAKFVPSLFTDGLHCSNGAPIIRSPLRVSLILIIFTLGFELFTF
jgi:hypothetical protein